MAKKQLDPDLVEFGAVATIEKDQNQELQSNEAMDLMVSAAGAGQAHLNAGDVATPFLDILQKNSPQVEKDSGKTITGAEVGMIYNSGTNELYDGAKGITVVVCAYDKRWVEWISRDMGGGFVASYPYVPTPPVVREATTNEKKMLITTDGNEVRETAYYFVLHVEDGSPSPAIVAMSRTKLKPSRMWNKMWSEFKLVVKDQRVDAPIFARYYQLTTVKQIKKTYTYFNWVVTPGPRLGQKDLPILRVAMKAHEDFEKGRVVIGAPPQDSEASDADENIPY